MGQDTRMEPGGEVEAPAGYDQHGQTQQQDAPPWVAGLERWTYFSARLRGPYGRRADFDLFLYRRDGRRSLERSRRLGSREYVARWLPPGRHEAAIASYRGYGGYRVRFDYD
jgi:hypothetical protein